MPSRIPPVPAELAQFLASCPSSIRDLALRARSLVLAHSPDLTETVRPGWKMIGYGATPKMADMVVGLAPAKAHLGVHLAGGVDLPDPEELLEGTSRTGRHIRITSPRQLDAPAVRALIAGAFELSRARRGSPAAKTRARPAAAAGAGEWERPVSDDAVATKTGRTWDEWIRVLDAEGCATMTHREIVAVVGDRFDVGPWWQQMVTVGYERARGLRGVHETTQGYQVGASKTVGVPLEALWRAWSDTRTRRRWLADDFTVRKATEPKSMRITWHDGSDVQVLFYAKGDAKSQVTVDHRKLPQPRVDEVKAFWKERLGALRAQLERRPARG